MCFGYSFVCLETVLYVLDTVLCVLGTVLCVWVQYCTVDGNEGFIRLRVIPLHLPGC